MKLPWIMSATFSRLCVIGCMAVIAISSVFAVTSEISEGIWRKPGNDAINSLYLFLRLNGYEGSYETFASQTHSLRDDPSLTSLARIAHELGYPTTVVKSSMDQVLETTFPKPAIFFCEHAGAEAGKWRLLLSANRRYVVLLDGERVFLRLVSVDKFRMEWSGYALTSKVAPTFLKTALRRVSFAGAGLAGLSLLFIRHTGRGKCRSNT